MKGRKEGVMKGGKEGGKEGKERKKRGSGKTVSGGGREREEDPDNRYTSISHPLI